MLACVAALVIPIFILFVCFIAAVLSLLLDLAGWLAGERRLCILRVGREAVLFS
jgi:hypothetical protein